MSNAAHAVMIFIWAYLFLCKTNLTNSNMKAGFSWGGGENELPHETCGRTDTLHGMFAGVWFLRGYLYTLLSCTQSPNPER